MADKNAQFSFRSQVVRAHRIDRAQTVQLTEGTVEANAGDSIATDLNNGGVSVWPDASFRSYFSAADDAGAAAFSAQLTTEEEDSMPEKNNEPATTTTESTGDPSRQGDGSDPSRVDSSTDPSRDGNEKQAADEQEVPKGGGGTESTVPDPKGGAAAGTHGHVDSHEGGTQPSGGKKKK